MKISSNIAVQSYFRLGIIFYSWAVLLCSCSSSSKTIRPHSDSTISIDWLMGNWIRSNEQEGRTTYEYWNKESDQRYTGIGLTIASTGDTIFREDLKIIPILNRWAMIVTGVNESPTRFLMESNDEGQFTVQNLENEFPKYIEYRKVGEQLKAKVYNEGENIINFEFDKLEK